MGRMASARRQAFPIAAKASPLTGRHQCILLADQCYFSYGFSVSVSVIVVIFQLQLHLLFFSFYFYFS